MIASKVPYGTYRLYSNGSKMSICFGDNIDRNKAEFERSDGNQASDLKICGAVGKDSPIC